MISVKNLKKSFISQGVTRVILDSISFDIPESSFTTFFGPNGCGKTTLVNIISGLEKEYSGKILAPDITKHEIGYVFQDYRRSLLPWHSVEENILFPLTIQGLNRTEKHKKLEQLLSVTSLKLDLSQRVFSLSGGQAQAVCILRALIINPRILILDEPFAALDYEITLALRRLISDISRAMKLTVLFISHDLEEALILGDQVVFLSRHPTKVVEVLKVDLPYPRKLELVTSQEFIDLKARSINLMQTSRFLREDGSHENPK